MSLPTSNSINKPWLFSQLFLCITLCSLGVFFQSHSFSRPLFSLIFFGSALISSAFILAWVGEALQLDITQGFAIAILALIAVLPEYAVDVHLAYDAATHPESAKLTIANMTGANRLLLGVGWPLIIIIGIRQLSKNKSAHINEVKLTKDHSIDLTILFLSSFLSLSMVFFKYVSIFHSIGLICFFLLYIWRLSSATSSEPHLIGVAKLLGSFPPLIRRICVGLLLIFSTFVIYKIAHPFVESLKTTAGYFHINEFITVQWIAPLASEAPEFTIALIFALRGQPLLGFSTLLSSKVNQWTLLISSLPIAYSVGNGSIQHLPLDARQIEEIVLTSAQTFMGIAFLSNLTFSAKESWILLGLFGVQFLLPHEGEMAIFVRYLLSFAYFLIAFGVFTVHRKSLWQHLKHTFHK